MSEGSYPMCLFPGRMGNKGEKGGQGDEGELVRTPRLLGCRMLWG